VTHRAGNLRKESHLETLEASGLFRFTREALVHSRDRGNADRIVGMALSLGTLSVALKRGASEEELGLAQLRETARRVLGDREVSWFMCYRVRLGIK
jgi:hypothetical protein